jgi:hypothetical protein
MYSWECEPTLFHRKTMRNRTVRIEAVNFCRRSPLNSQNSIRKKFQPVGEIPEFCLFWPKIYTCGAWGWSQLRFSESFHGRSCWQLGGDEIGCIILRVMKVASSPEESSSSSSTSSSDVSSTSSWVAVMCVKTFRFGVAPWHCWVLMHFDQNWKFRINCDCLHFVWANVSYVTVSRRKTHRIWRDLGA